MLIVFSIVSMFKCGCGVLQVVFSCYGVMIFFSIVSMLKYVVGVVIVVSALLWSC